MIFEHNSKKNGVDKELSIVVVNYNKFMQTEQCINSVLETVKNINYEIIVIDNNSPNESFNYLYDKYKSKNNIEVIKNDINSGFGAANNLGVQLSQGSYILFLNPDVVVLEQSVERIYEILVSNDEVGLISCKLLNEDMSLQYSCRRFLSFREFLIARTPVKKIFNKEKVKELNNKYLMADYDHVEETYVDWVMGSCMLCRREDFLIIGGFSKEYFMYFEDVDLCYKVKQLNKKVLYYPQTQMIHLHSQDSVKKINKLTFIHLNSMFKFYNKYRLG